MTADQEHPGARACFPDATYILPLKWASDTGLPELVRYLERLSGWIQVIVVDGSAEQLFVEHAKRLPQTVRHLRALPLGLNGKVAGVLTGLTLSTTTAIVIADDDVRYDADTLHQAVALLDNADIVRPQNYFTSLPWHARWDTARTLINRAFGSDYPGTLIVRRESLLRTDGYDGNVLFENLELLRTIHAAGGQEVRANDLYIGRLPPTFKQFLRQRIRQAYDDFAQPKRLAIELTLLPLAIVLGRNRRLKASLCGGFLAVACLLAEIGRRRQRGNLVFSRYSALWAPLWVLERSICIWAALVFRVTGGMPYAGTKLKHAANTATFLQQKHRGKIPHRTNPDGTHTVTPDPYRADPISMPHSSPRERASR